MVQTNRRDKAPVALEVQTFLRSSIRDYHSLPTQLDYSSLAKGKRIKIGDATLRPLRLPLEPSRKSSFTHHTLAQSQTRPPLKLKHDCQPQLPSPGHCDHRHKEITCILEQIPYNENLLNFRVSSHAKRTKLRDDAARRAEYEASGFGSAEVWRHHSQTTHRRGREIQFWCLKGSGGGREGEQQREAEEDLPSLPSPQPTRRRHYATAVDARGLRRREGHGDPITRKKVPSAATKHRHPLGYVTPTLVRVMTRTRGCLDGCLAACRLFSQ
uniref:Uncharacterized protein n=1 Tax=Physcomitrium patens TaxID=3218 RepID=A9TBL3_PHYPA|nr:hypothetical protein PHYPA_012297 [Physcomitrium patens]